MGGSLQHAEGASLRSGPDSLENRAGADKALRDIEVVLIHLVVVLRVGHSRLEELLQRLAGRFGGVL